MKNIVLIGLMGTGKSAVGRKLAKELKFQFIDTDRLIEEKTGKTISALFAEEDGEKKFRVLEEEVLAQVIAQEQAVISTGGGVMLSPVNRLRLRQCENVVWLRARPDKILERVEKKAGKRPLLTGKDPLSIIKRLLTEREPYYKEAAVSVDTSDRNITEVVAEVKKGVRFVKLS